MSFDVRLCRRSAEALNVIVDEQQVIELPLRRLLDVWVRWLGRSYLFNGHLQACRVGVNGQRDAARKMQGEPTTIIAEVYMRQLLPLQPVGDGQVARAPCAHGFDWFDFICCWLRAAVSLASCRLVSNGTLIQLSRRA